MTLSFLLQIIDSLPLCRLHTGPLSVSTDAIPEQLNRLEQVEAESSRSFSYAQIQFAVWIRISHFSGAQIFFV